MKTRHSRLLRRTMSLTEFPYHMMPKPRPQGLLVSNIAAAREGAFFGEI